MVDQRQPRAGATVINYDDGQRDRVELFCSKARGARDAPNRPARLHAILGRVDGTRTPFRGGSYVRTTRPTGSMPARSRRCVWPGSLNRRAEGREPNEWVAVVGSWHPNQFMEKRLSIRPV